MCCNKFLFSADRKIWKINTHVTYFFLNLIMFKLIFSLILKRNNYRFCRNHNHILLIFFKGTQYPTRIKISKNFFFQIFFFFSFLTFFILSGTPIFWRYKRKISFLFLLAVFIYFLKLYQYCHHHSKFSLVVLRKLLHAKIWI